MADRFKQALRLTCQHIRQKLSPAYQQTTAHRIADRIYELDQYQKAKNIALYRAINGEINLDQVWHSALAQDKHCYFPVLNENHTLSFLPAASSSQFRKNRFGIQEPDLNQDQALSLEQLDLMFVPIVAFDSQGTRLGMGAGYYDRTLAHMPRPFLIGVAYEFQRQSHIEAQPWDIPLDVVITEQAIYWRQF